MSQFNSHPMLSEGEEPVCVPARRQSGMPVYYDSNGIPTVPVPPASGEVAYAMSMGQNDTARVWLAHRQNQTSFSMTQKYEAKMKTGLFSSRKLSISVSTRIETR